MFKPDSSSGYGVTNMLKAYNLLNGKNADTSILKPVFKSTMEPTDKFYKFHLEVRQACKLTLHFTWQDGTAQPPHKETSITKKMKPGYYLMKVQLPAADTTKAWKMMTVTGQVQDGQSQQETPAFTWRIGCEKELDTELMPEGLRAIHAWPRKNVIKLKLKR